MKTSEEERVPEHDRKRDAPTAEPQAPDLRGPSKNDREASSPRPACPDDLSAADQALINLERAIDSGDENVV